MRATLTVNAEKLLDMKQLSDPRTGQIVTGYPGDYYCETAKGEGYIESAAFFESQYATDEKAEPEAKPTKKSKAK